MDVVLISFICFFIGCGFVGRHLVTYLINNDLVSYVRVVDKTPSQMAWLNTEHMTAFNDNAVEFISANLMNEGQYYYNYIQFVGIYCSEH